MLEAKQENRKDLLVIANSILFNKVISGGDIVLPQILKYADFTGINLHVITTQRGRSIWQSFGIEAKFYLLPDYFLEKLEFIALVPLIYCVRLLFTLCNLPKICFNLKRPFLVYTSSDFFVDCVPAAFLKQAGGRWLARVYHVIEQPFKRRGNAAYNMLSFLGQRFSFWLIKNNADKVITLSGTALALVHCGFPLGKLYVSDIGVDADNIKKAVPYKEIFEAVYIGGILHTKGTYDLIPIWKKVVETKPDARLAIIGGATKNIMDEFNFLITQAGLEKNIRYFGYIKDPVSVYSILKSSKIYLCPGHENGFSIPVAEALTCGIPVVSYKLKMFGTAFKKGFLTVGLHDKEAFARSILELLNNEVKWSSLADEASLEAEKFDWRKISSGFISLLNL